MTAAKADKDLREKADSPQPRNSKATIPSASPEPASVPGPRRRSGSSTSSRPPPGHMLAWQRAAGNQAVAGLLNGLTVQRQSGADTITIDRPDTARGSAADHRAVTEQTAAAPPAGDSPVHRRFLRRPPLGRRPPLIRTSRAPRPLRARTGTARALLRKPLTPQGRPATGRRSSPASR